MEPEQAPPPPPPPDDEHGPQRAENNHQNLQCFTSSGDPAAPKPSQQPKRRRVRPPTGSVVPRRSARLAPQAAADTVCSGAGGADAEAGKAARPAEVPGHHVKLWLDGEMYEFDSVASYKVQAVILLLAGGEVPDGDDSVPSPSSSIGVPQEDEDSRRKAASMPPPQKKRKRDFDTGDAAAGKK